MPKSTKNNQSTEKLKQRIAELEQENAKLKNMTKVKKKSGHWLRTITSAFLIFMASLMLVSSIMFTWLQRTILDTDTWVSKTSQIINTESVQQDVSDRISTELLSKVDVNKYVAEALPEKAAPLAPAIASGVEGFIKDKTSEIVASDKFAEVWTESNRISHQSLINSITRLNTINSENNSSDVIYIVDDSLMLNLLPVLNEVKQNLIERGVTFLPENEVISQDRLTYEIAQIDNLPLILGFYNMLNKLSYWLPILAVITGAGAVFVANNRRRAFGAIIVVSIVMAIASVQLIKAGQYGVSQSVVNNSETLSTESAVAIYQIITNDLITSLRWLMGALALIGLFIFLTGPHTFAVWLRNKFGGLIKNYKQNKFIKNIAKNAYSAIAIICLITAALIVFVPFSSPWFVVITIVIGGLLSITVMAVKQELES